MYLAWYRPVQQVGPCLVLVDLSKIGCSLHPSDMLVDMLQCEQLLP